MEYCSKIGCGGGSYLVHRGVLELTNGSSDHSARSPSSFPVNNRGGNRGFGATISASMAEAVLQHTGIDRQKRRSSGGGVDRRSPDAAAEREEMDRWMKESVVEIVKNLRHAPLLVHVYDGGEGRVVVTRAEEWEDVKRRWRKGEVELPDGMIFVEELAGDSPAEECGCGGGEGTRAWGLVVQGKGVETGPVCYLLKTTRVGSGSGSVTGVGSTHFCLMRVSSFMETAESQLMNCWLVGRRQGYGFSFVTSRGSKQ